MERKTRVFSGIQASGSPHIGNYLGAIKHWAAEQEGKENFFCVVDLHAITTPQDPETLRFNINEAAKILLASGIDPAQSTLFVQSDRPEHSELAWILNCFTGFGELSRMTQFKEKGEGKADVSVGLFDYPVLMAADILLYDTESVPVGEDQKQHVELTRNIAERMNNKFKGMFVVPDADIKKTGARIMALDNPTKKMSKSAGSENSYIAIRDDAETIRKKIAKAVTDTGAEVKYDKENKPAISNLLTIYSGFADESVEEIEKRYVGKSYAEFKKDLAEVVIAGLAPIQDQLAELDADPTYVAKVIAEGAQKAAPIAASTLIRVKEKLGLG